MMATTTHARRSDPLSSELTLRSLGRDTTAKARVIQAAARIELQTRQGGGGHRPWTDTELLEEIEHMTNKRWQRNVVARTRGLLVNDGWIEQAGMFTFRGKPHLHFRLTEQAARAS